MDSRMRTLAFVTSVATVSAEFCSDYDKTTLLADDRYVNAVNYFRCLHGQPNVVLETTLVTQATTDITSCPTTSATGAGYSWSVYTKGLVQEDAVESWYQQRFSSTTLKLLGTQNEAAFVTGTIVKPELEDFTAIMWKSVTKIGCITKLECPSTATKTGYTLCRFGIPKTVDAKVTFESPNVYIASKHEFLDNLPRSLAFKKSRGECCAEIYGTSLPSGAKPKYYGGYTSTTNGATTTPLYGATTTTSYGFDCSSFQCPVGGPSINKGKNIKCGVLQASCTQALCCQSYATCDTLICPSGQSGSVGKICGKTGLALAIKDCVAADCCPVANCGTFKGCTGKDAAGVPIKKNAGASVSCTGSEVTCDIDTCCRIPLDEDTCFPGEAEVSVQDRSGMRVDEIEPGMTVFAETGFEPVFGMLHLHSAVSPTFAHATTASV